MKKKFHYMFVLLACLLASGIHAGIACGEGSKVNTALLAGTQKKKCIKSSVNTTEVAADFILSNRVLLF